MSWNNKEVNFCVQLYVHISIGVQPSLCWVQRTVPDDKVVWA